MEVNVIQNNGIITKSINTKGMTLNEYQDKAMTTCMPSSENFSYMMLNLVGEVGEFASKVAKAIRKEDATIGDAFKTGKPNEKAIHNALIFEREDKEYLSTLYKYEDELFKEAGDIMWQIAGLCHVMGWTLESVCQENLDKLASRKKRGVIDGNGDNR